MADIGETTGLETYIPKGWKILGKAEGDLNGDQQPDLALIIENTDPKNIMVNGNLDGTELNLNHRKLLILFKIPLCAFLSICGLYAETIPIFNMINLFLLLN